MDEFVQILSAAMSLYNRGLSKAEATLWVSMMYREGIESRVAICALQEYLANPDKGQFAPKPADLIGIVKGNSSTRKLEAAEAWALVDNTIRMAGRYRDVIFEDAAIHTAITMLGGWVTICGAESDEELRFIGKDFVNVYTIARQKTGHAKILLGSQPGAREPYFAGDHDKCKALLEQTEVRRELPTINVKTLPDQASKQ